jgi:hypothetical protein
VAVTGTWKAGAVRADTSAEPLGHPEYSAYHARTDFTPAGSRPPYAAPTSRAQTPPALTDDMTAYDTVMPDSAPGTPLDFTPTEDHDIGDPMPFGAGRSYRGNRVAANRARSRDKGAARWRLLRPLQLDEGERDTDRLEVLPSNPGSRVGVVRGDNSYPENNPEGDGAGGPVRNGFRVQRWYNRRIPMHYRTHDVRAVRDHLAATGKDTPALALGNRYSSPFSSMASGRSRTAKSPVSRRVPRPWDDDVLSDGVTPYDSPLSPSWGL